MTTTYQRVRLERTGRSDRTLALGFAVSIGIHLLLIGIYAVATGGVMSSEPSITEGNQPKEFRIRLSRIAQRTVEAPGSSVKDRPQTAGTSSSAHGAALRRAGSLPVPTNDSVVDDLFPMGNPVAIIDGDDLHDLRPPAPIGGDREIEKTVAPPKEVPDVDADIFDGIDPQVDLALLQSHVIYPEMARTHGIEGQVVVRVLIDAQGKAGATQVQYSNSKLLETAAVDAIRRTQFKPGIQNGKPVAVWMVIPVRFQLH